LLGLELASSRSGERKRELAHVPFEAEEAEGR